MAVTVTSHPADGSPVGEGLLCPGTGSFRVKASGVTCVAAADAVAAVSRVYDLADLSRSGNSGTYDVLLHVTGGKAQVSLCWPGTRGVIGEYHLAGVAPVSVDAP